MPALLTSASIDWNRDSAVSAILAAVAGSPMWPSTRATWSEAATSVDWVTFRELATTLKPRSRNALTIPAPIPCEAPVTMAVFRWLLMIFYLDRYFRRKARRSVFDSVLMRCRATLRRTRIVYLLRPLDEPGRLLRGVVGGNDLIVRTARFPCFPKR